MIQMPKTSGRLTNEDIRIIRDYYADRYTDEHGNYDWEGALAEMEIGAARVRADLETMRLEELNSEKLQSSSVI